MGVVTPGRRLRLHALRAHHHNHSPPPDYRILVRLHRRNARPVRAQVDALHKATKPAHARQTRPRASRRGHSWSATDVAKLGSRALSNLFQPDAKFATRACAHQVELLELVDRWSSGKERSARASEGASARLDAQTSHHLHPVQTTSPGTSCKTSAHAAARIAHSQDLTSPLPGTRARSQPLRRLRKDASEVAVCWEPHLAWRRLVRWLRQWPDLLLA
jgi:hypothetical protein